MQVKQYQQKTAKSKVGGGVQVPMSAAQTQQRINPNQVGFGYLAAMEAAEATAETMGTLAKAGEQMFNLGARIDDWDQTAKYNKAMAQGSESLLQYADGLNERQDYQNFETDLAKQAGELKQRLAEGLHGPYAQRFGLEFDNDVLQTQVKARTAQRAKAADNALATEAEARQADMNMIGRPGMSSAERDRIQRRHLERVETMHKQGLITASKAKELVLTFDGFRSEVELKEIIDANPAGGLAMLKAPEGKAAELLADIPANRLDDLSEYAEKKQKAALAQAKKQAEDRAYAAIKRHIGDDLDKQLAALSDPVKIKGLGLSVEQAQSLKTVFKTEAAERLEQATGISHTERTEATKQYYELVKEGKRSQALQFLQATAAILPKDKATMEAALQKEGWATDPAIKAKVIRGIHTGQITSLDQLAGYLGHGLSVEDYEAYAGDLEKKDKDAAKQAKGLNFFDMAVKEFDHQGKGDEWKAKKNDFSITLDYLMKKEGLEPTDPRVQELGKKLLDDVASSEGTWWSAVGLSKDVPRFEQIAGQKPWLDPQAHQNDEYGYDVDLMQASGDELEDVREMLSREQQNAPGLYNPDSQADKRLALRAVRQGGDMLDIALADLRTLGWNAFSLREKYGAKKTWNAVQFLKSRGARVTEASVEYVLRRKAGR